jgi:hypothetical protein
MFSYAPEAMHHQLLRMVNAGFDGSWRDALDHSDFGIGEIVKKGQAQGAFVRAAEPF